MAGPSNVISVGDPSLGLTIQKPKFNQDDADRAHEVWGCNCGPGALAAIAGLTLDEVRPHLIGFDAKRYTNPTMMFGALRSIGLQWKSTPTDQIGWPLYGLCRVQWEGPWTDPGVPMRARYRYTHWIGAAGGGTSNVGVFDINAIGNGSGWCRASDWKRTIAPTLMQLYPRAYGTWHLTHVIEVRHAEPR